ncbi:MAG: hypothetical protein ACI9GO_000570 [Bacteroidia bacterium]
MKKSFKLLLILALGAGVLTLNSCSDEAEEEPTPAVPVCYMTSLEVSSGTTAFLYNSDNQVVTSIEDGDTTTYEYSEGRLSSVYDGDVEATFIYASGNVPERINIKEDGVDAGFFILEGSNGNITKLEIHDEAGEVTQVTNVTYDANGNALSVLVQSWDEEQMDFVTVLQVSDILTDGKKNPYATSLALVFANLESPLVFGQSNIISGNADFMGQNVPITSTHIYNSNNYPTSSIVAQGLYSGTYTFDCK